MTAVVPYNWEEALSDMVLATGLPFEVVVKFTDAQFVAIRNAMIRHWKLLASTNGFQAAFSSAGNESVDATAQFEARVKSMKRATGKDKLDLWEVI